MTTRSPQTDSGVQVLDRATEILRCFTPETPRRTYSQIVAATGLSKATAHRLLTALEANGLLRRACAGGEYALGYQMLRWASIAQQSLDLPRLARPLLEQLVATTGETALLLIRDGDRALCLERVDSPQPLRLAVSIGDRILLHAGSSAKVFLAYADESDRARVIAQSGLPGLHRNTITDDEVLRVELARIRDQGYATSCEERDAGAAGVTAPVFDAAGNLAAAIGIVGPLTRMTPDALPRLIDAVVQAGRQLSRQLGCP